MGRVNDRRLCVLYVVLPKVNPEFYTLLVNKIIKKTLIIISVITFYIYIGYGHNIGLGMPKILRRDPEQ